MGRKPSRKGLVGVLAVALALVVTLGAVGLASVSLVAAGPTQAQPVETASAHVLAAEAENETEREAAELYPAFSFTWQILLAGVVAGAITALCTAATGGVGAAGCVYLGLVVGVGVAAYLYFEQLTAAQASADVLYAPAVEAFSQVMESFADNVSQTAALAANVGELTDGLTGLYGYEASAASGEQLPAGTFNPYLDLIDSGVAGQMLSTIDGIAYGEWADLNALYTTMDNLYGPSGHYGGDGLVCQVYTNGTYFTSNGTEGSSYYFDYGPIPDVAHANLNYGPDGACNEDIGSDQVAPVTFSDNAVGVLLPINASYSAAFLEANGWASNQFTTDLPLYVAPNATFDAASAPQGHLIPLVSTPETGGCGEAVAPCLLVDMEGPVTIDSAGSQVVLTLTNGVPTKFTGASGLYYLENETACDITCIPAIPGENYLLGSGVLPFEWGDSSQEVKYADTTALGAVSSETDYLSDTTESLVTYACGVSPTAQDVYPAVSDTYSGSLSAVSVCPSSVAGLLGEVNTEMEGATDIAQAYWSFLHGLGVYQASSMPADCVIPTPADFLPPDTSLSQIITFGPHDIANMLDAYIAAFSLDYAAPGSTLDSETFCGYHLPPPGTITLDDPGWEFLGSLYTHSDGQSFADASTWLGYQVGMDLLPQDGNLTIPVNTTWEAPAANPSVVYWGDTIPAFADVDAKNAASAVIDLSSGGVITSLAGNSTNRQGSVYPASTDSRLGPGDALNVTECYHNESGTWKSVATCYDNVTVLSYIQPNGTSACYFQGSCSVNGTGGFPLPSAGINCGFFLASDLAAPFQHLSFYGISLGGFACFIGWLLTIAIVVLIILAVVWVAKDALAGSRRS